MTRFIGQVLVLTRADILRDVVCYFLTCCELSICPASASGLSNVSNSLIPRRMRRTIAQRDYSTRVFVQFELGCIDTHYFGVVYQISRSLVADTDPRRWPQRLPHLASLVIHEDGILGVTVWVGKTITLIGNVGLGSKSSIFSFFFMLIDEHSVFALSAS